MDTCPLLQTVVACLSFPKLDRVNDGTQLAWGWDAVRHALPPTVTFLPGPSGGLSIPENTLQTCRTPTPLVGLGTSCCTEHPLPGLHLSPRFSVTPMVGREGMPKPSAPLLNLISGLVSAQ